MKTPWLIRYKQLRLKSADKKARLNLINRAGRPPREGDSH